MKDMVEFLLDVCKDNPFEKTALDWLRENHFLVYERIVEKYGIENLDEEEEGIRNETACPQRTLEE